jgi:hypothetical protein
MNVNDIETFTNIAFQLVLLALRKTRRRRRRRRRERKDWAKIT